jgi:hypothetical protein
MNKDTIYMLDTLTRAGITLDDAMALRRISMTLHRWHELECGDDSGCIERGDNGEGKPFMVRWNAYTGKRMQWAIADRETGALRRLGVIMARYPSLMAYVQGDPRGAALYILRPDDVPEGKDVDAYYSRGLAVYK